MKISENLTKSINHSLKALGYEVEPSTATKNNVTLEGYTLKKIKGYNKVCPMIYVDGFDTEREVIDFIIAQTKKETPHFDAEEITTKEYILENVMAEVVSASSNLVTEDILYRTFVDLAIIYRVKVDDGEDGAIGSYVIGKELAKKAGVTEEELFEIVSNNKEYRTVTLIGMLGELTEVPDDMLIDDDSDIEMPYVVTNKNGLYGANVLCTNYLEDVRKQLGGDLAIIPCSVHELIVVKKSDRISVDAIKEMVVSVNSTCISAQDKLSDSVYSYDENGLSQIA